jgi:catechol 2,3-dioxygenase-like lactoylglutathione lyase family enzyme
MLSRVDRVQMVVRDRKEAVTTFRDFFDAEQVGDDVLDIYNARRATVQAGVSEFELLEPAGPGPAADFADQRRGEGLFAAGLATPDLTALTGHLTDAGVEWREEKGQVFIDPSQTRGMRAVISEDRRRESVGLISFLYEVTNIVGDADAAANQYADIFGLDASRFAPIASHGYGYNGTLTLFNPPEQLDRIEITQTYDSNMAMGRFYEKWGESLYMCFIEAPDLRAIAERLEQRGARWTPDPMPHTLFLHPTALHGMLMGVSRTTHAWTWSGRPELVQAAV